MDFEVRHIDGTTVKLISSEHKCAITSATQTRKLCGNDTVTINLQSATYIDFYVGDKITIFGTTYTMNQLPTVKKESERSYTYTLVFEGLQYTLIDRVFLMPDNTQGDNLMFDLAGMLDVLDDNINRGNSGKLYEFVLDESLEETEYKNLSLTGKNCLQVLQQLCQEWDTEFVFAEEPNRIAIYIGVAGSTFPTTFKYGRGGGVYELNREKGASDICTRLFVYGGTQNLTYYRHNRLCLPSKEKNQSYVEDATAQAVYGIKEQVKNFDDIYPNRIGTITSLSGCDYNEFIDSAMADSQYGFDLNEKWANNADDCEEWLALKGLEDTEANRTIYYNDVAGTATKYLMAGATAKIHFNTGALAGYECDLHSYTHSSQKFVLKQLVDENGYDFPSKTNAAFKLAVGDEYVILDINLPTAYKEQAESKLATEAASYFDTVCRPQPKYTLTIEPIALKHIVGPSTADTEIFKVGDLINISDPTGGVESATIRIDQFVRNLLDPFDYKLTLTDEITYSQQVRTLIEVDAIKRVVEESKIYDVNRIRRGWKDAEELYNQMFDTEGHYYSEKIAPLSIDTQMLKVGARSQQLVLQNVLFQPNYNANPANLQISAGSLVHYTIAEPDIKTWTMSALSASNVPSTAQYVYAKCAKNGTTGTWLVTDQAIIFDSDPSYYHFLVGSLSSVDSVSNTRNFAATYGFTTINGRNITTGVIKSSDGSSVFIDLDAGIIKGNITFEAGTTSYGALQDIISGNTTVQGAVTTANRAEGKIDGLEIGGRNLLAFSNPNFYKDSAGGLSVVMESDGWLHITGTISTTGYIVLTPKWGNFTEANTIAKNDKYTLTIEERLESGKNGLSSKFYIQTFAARLGTTDYDLQLLKYSAGTLQLDYTGRWLLRVTCFSDSGGNGTQIDTLLRFKLEKGTISTDWTPAPEDTEAELTAMQSDLQGQIDSKIETWSQSADPSTNWTAAEKTAHTGDLWQYTGTTTSTRTHNATYRWSGSAWVEQQASQDIFDKIDGKAAIFYNSTESGYNPEGVQDGDYLLISSGENQGKSFRRLNGAWVSVQDYQAAIANIQIGGRNLITNTGDLSGQWSYQINNPANTWQPPIAQEKFRGNSVAAISTAWRGVSKVVECQAGEQFTFSVWLKSSASQRIILYQVWYTNGAWTGGSSAKDSWYGNSWTLASVTITIPENTTKFLLVTESVDNTTYYLSSLKIEKGNKATDWSPAPEDVDAQLYNITSDGIISGGSEKADLMREWQAIAGVNKDGTSGGSYKATRDKATQTIKTLSPAVSAADTALATAFTNLKAKVYNGTGTVLNDTATDTTLSSLSLTSAQFIELWTAYYNAETALENALQEYFDDKIRKNLQAVSETDTTTADKVVACDDWKDSFFKAGTRITIEFAEANSTEYPYLVIGGTKCFLEYAGGLSGKSGTTYIGSPKWVKGQQIAFTYDGEKTNSTPSGDETRHTFKVEDEAAFKATLILAKSVEGTTDIMGGLVLTNTIMLRDENNAFTAGLSGLKENDIAFWAGGTLQNAMADTAKVWIKHGGMARFGAVYIDGRNTGDMTMRDSQGNTRLKIKNSPLTLTAASAEVAYNSGNNRNDGTYATGSSLSSTSITGTESNKQSTDIFTLGNLNHTGTFEFEVAIRIESLAINVQPAAAGGDYLVELEFYNGAAWESVGRFSVDADVVANNVLATSNNPLVYSKTYQGTPNGYGYCQIGLRARYWTTRQSAPGTSPAGYLTFSGVKWCYYKDNTKASMQIANNGMAYYLNANNMLVVQPDANDTALTTTIKGNTDIPGVLWAGTITNQAGVTPHYKNSAKYASNQLACDTWNSTNKYFRITHRLGSADFAAMVTPSSSAVTVRTTKDSTYLYVYLSAQASFDLVLFGTN